MPEVHDAIVAYQESQSGDSVTYSESANPSLYSVDMGDGGYFSFFESMGAYNGISPLFYSSGPFHAIKNVNSGLWTVDSLGALGGSGYNAIFSTCNYLYNRNVVLTDYFDTLSMKYTAESLYYWSDCAAFVAGASPLEMLMAAESFTYMCQTGFRGIVYMENPAVGESINTTTQAILKNGYFTVAGRALTKHPDIVGANSAQELYSMYGNQTGINQAAEIAIRDIISNGTYSTSYHTVWGNTIQYQLPNGLGVKFQAETYKFIGFLRRGL